MSKVTGEELKHECWLVQNLRSAIREDQRGRDGLDAVEFKGGVGGGGGGRKRG